MVKQARPGKGPTEEEIQTQLFQLRDLHKSRFPLLRWLHAIPNGGYRKPGEAGRFKASGVQSGVPDLDWPVASQISELTYYGLRIELKRGREGVVSPAQQEWIDGLRSIGQCVQVCRSLEAAWAVICWYGHRAGCKGHFPSVAKIGPQRPIVIKMIETGDLWLLNSHAATQVATCPLEDIWFHATDLAEYHSFKMFCQFTGLVAGCADPISG